MSEKAKQSGESARNLVTWKTEHINSAGSALEIDCHNTPLAAIFQRNVGAPDRKEQVFELIFATEKNNLLHAVALWVSWSELRKAVDEKSKSDVLVMFDEWGYKVLLRYDEAALAEILKIVGSTTDKVGGSAMKERVISRYDTKKVSIRQINHLVSIEKENNPSGEIVYYWVHESVTGEKLRMRIGTEHDVLYRLMLSARNFSHRFKEHIKTDELFLASFLERGDNNDLVERNYYMPISLMMGLINEFQLPNSHGVSDRELVDTVIPLQDFVIKQWHTMRSRVIEERLQKGESRIGFVVQSATGLAFLSTLFSGGSLIFDAISSRLINFELAGEEFWMTLTIFGAFASAILYAVSEVTTNVQKEFNVSLLLSHNEKAENTWLEAVNRRRQSRATHLQKARATLQGK